MTISNSTFRKITATLCPALIFFAVPAMALASVHITNVMYDPEGADAGHEWIEIANQDSTPVNLYGYRLGEGGTNHKITVVSGTSTLLAGATAVIVTDPAEYSLEHPSFAGTVFKSSFSLSNTGETIELKDAKLSVVDSYNYTAPPVVKAVPVKKAKKLSAKSKSALSQTNAKVTTPFGGGDSGTAALPLVGTPGLPALPTSWAYGLGLAALLVVGGGAALYAKPASQSIRFETLSDEEEFNIE
jgi:hypothetical protein